MKAYSGQYMQGDESNQRPLIPGYAVAGFTGHVEYRGYGIELEIANLLDRRYDTYGIEAENSLGPYRSNTPPAHPAVVPFLTPGLPAHFTLTVSKRL